jgi:hypothetical protein
MGLLEDYRALGFICQEGQYRTSEVRVHLPGRAVQYRTTVMMIRLWESPVKKTDTVDRQNTAEGITEKNPRARIPEREDNIFCLSGARLCNE